jgi:hypothetical protein
MGAAFYHVFDVVFLDDDMMKMVVPAAMYAVQNNLIYVAASNLDPIVCYCYTLTIL